MGPMQWQNSQHIARTKNISTGNSTQKAMNPKIYQMNMEIVGNTLEIPWTYKYTMQMLVGGGGCHILHSKLGQ